MANFFQNLMPTLTKPVQSLSNLHFATSKRFVQSTFVMNQTINSFIQAFMVWKNEDIPPETRKFMVTQELSDGLGRAVLYSTFIAGVENVLFNKIAKPWMTKNLVPPDGKSIEPFIKSSDKIINSFVAPMLAFTVLTPVFRNVMANYFKHHAKKKGIDTGTTNELKLSDPKIFGKKLAADREGLGYQESSVTGIAKPPVLNMTAGDLKQTMRI